MPNRAERRASRRIKTEELRLQAIEAMGQTAYMEIETDDEQVFLIPHPLLVDDVTQARYEAFQAGEDLDKDEDGNIKVPNRIKDKLAEPYTIRQARAIMGDLEHKKFIKAGGNSSDVTLAWNEMTREQKELREDDDPKVS